MNETVLEKLPLSGARLWNSIMVMARIGATTKGGCNRQALTDLDGEGRRLLRHWAEAAGLVLGLDRVGNMAFRREGRDPSRAPVAIGSHLDTQPTGGKFDGVLGVLAGLEVMRAMHEVGAQTEAPLLLINWTNEEGARFSPPMMGSGVAMGLFGEGEILGKVDAAGATFGDELRRIGWQGDADPAVLQALQAYFELHIEQGPILEGEGCDIGVVTHALAQRWYEVAIEGEEAHAGSPMQGRRDAIMGAVPLITAVEEIALAAGSDGRGTVGRVLLQPDSRNIVPGQAWFSVDTRHGDPARLTWMGEQLRARAAEITAARDVAIRIDDFWSFPLTLFDPVLAQRVRDAAQARGQRWRDMPAAIGHDAVYLARRVPSALIFVPCHRGVSHNEAESITPEWAEAGLRVLAEAVLATAEVAAA